MAINFEYLRVFYAIARYQNITKAADELCLSRPTVTQELSKLEDQIGFRLFSRHSKGVSLTDEGKNLFHRISPALQTLLDTEQIYESASLLRNTTTLKLCFTWQHTMNAYNDLLNRISRDYPGMLFQYSIISFSAMAEALNQGIADLAFGARHSYKPFLPSAEYGESSGISEISFGIFDDYFIADRSLCLPDDKEFALNELSKYPLILYRDRDINGMSYYLDKIGQSADVAAQNLLIGETDAVKKLLKTGRYIAVIPAFHVRNLGSDYVRIQIKEPVIKTEYLVQYSNKRKPGDNAMQLIDLLRQYTRLGDQK